MSQGLSKEELVELIRRIMNAEGTEEEINEMINLFDANVPHPNGANLAFYPEDCDHKQGWKTIGEYNPSPEEVVEMALSYKPFITPPVSIGKES